MHDPQTIQLVAVASATFFLLFGLLAAEAYEHSWGKAIAKSGASLSFVVLAILAGALGSGFGLAVMAALVLSFAGDVLLLPTGTGKAFQAGVGAFLLGHVAYAVGFVGLDPALAVTAGAAVPLIAVGWAVGRWILPLAPSGLRKPVLAYIVVITTMVALAAGAAAGTGRPILAVAATAFFLSDLAVARERFVKSDYLNRALGLPLYYTAQVLFALSVLPPEALRG